MVRGLVWELAAFLREKRRFRPFGGRFRTVAGGAADPDSGTDFSFGETVLSTHSASPSDDPVGYIIPPVSDVSGTYVRC